MKDVRSQVAQTKAARVVASDLGDDYKFTRDVELAAERAEGRRRRRERSAARAKRRAAEWTTCLVPGCTLMCPAELQDGIEFPICSIHAAAVWENVERQLNSRNAEMFEALGALQARREAIRSEERKADAIEREERAAKVRKPDAQGWIYYVRANGLIKVGWTSDLERRLRAYGANAEILAHYEARRSEEAALHRQLAPSRAKGREWYHDDPIVQAFIYRATREHGQPTVVVAWTEPKPPTTRVRSYRG